jgi:hypothetical protein
LHGKLRGQRQLQRVGLSVLCLQPLACRKQYVRSPVTREAPARCARAAAPRRRSRSAAPSRVQFRACCPSGPWPAARRPSG